jgi:hypothetical protein
MVQQHIEVFTLLHVIHMDSSGPLARPDWLVKFPVQSNPVLVQWIEGPVRVQWNPVSPVHHYLLLIDINYE